jgi:hypothetical protein
MPDKLDVVKVNIDDNPRVAQRFEVLSTPVMILFDRGETRTRIPACGLRGPNSMRSRAVASR